MMQNKPTNLEKSNSSQWNSIIAILAFLYFEPSLFVEFDSGSNPIHIELETIGIFIISTIFISKIIFRLSGYLSKEIDKFAISINFSFQKIAVILFFTGALLLSQLGQLAGIKGFTLLLFGLACILILIAILYLLLALVFGQRAFK